MDTSRPGDRHPAACGGVGDPGGGLVYPTIPEFSTLADVLEQHVQKCDDDPVGAIRRAIRDVVVKKQIPAPEAEGRRKGETIKEFSHQSRYRLYLLIRNCGIVFYSMITVTYPMEFPSDGKLVKKHLHQFCVWLRKTFYGIRGVWFLEFQMRGAPHFHIITDVDLVSYGDMTTRRRRKKTPGKASYETCVEIEAAASRAWYRIVKSGDPKHLRAGTSWEAFEHPEAAERYAAKHSAKPRQKDVPEGYENVGRFWGVLGGVGVQWIDDDFNEATTYEVFSRFDPEQVMSSKGKVRKYIFGGTENERDER